MRLQVRLLTYGGYRATVIHRLAYWAHCRGLPALPTLLHELNQALHGIEITPSMKVGPGLYMPHSVGSVVTAQEIGEDVELQGGVTLGMRGAPEFPTIADGVVVSCGARILGPITVGNGSVVGANAVVIRDVEPGSVMVGVPAHPLVPKDRIAPGPREEISSD
ncbi:MAG: serine O-acetyltransferase [Dehalococcoidia bacterium]